MGRVLLQSLYSALFFAPDQGARVSLSVQRRWYLLAAAIAALVVLPLSVLLLSWQQVDTAIWAHLWQRRLIRVTAW